MNGRLKNPHPRSPLNLQQAPSPQIVGLALRVAPDDVATLVKLEIPRTHKHDVIYSYPSTALHLPADSANPFAAILAFDEDAVVAQQLGGYPEHVRRCGENQIAEVILAYDLLFSQRPTTLRLFYWLNRNRERQTLKYLYLNKKRHFAPQNNRKSAPQIRPIVRMVSFSDQPIYIPSRRTKN